MSATELLDHAREDMALVVTEDEAPEGPAPIEVHRLPASGERGLAHATAGADCGAGAAFRSTFLSSTETSFETPGVSMVTP